MQKGDIVRYLNAVGGGRVVRIEGNMAYVDEDGFETPVLVKECVVVTPASKVPAEPPQARLSTEVPKIVNTPVEEPAPEDTRETDYGNKISATLAFEPVDIKALSMTTFDTYLVNDSNYYLYFTFASRSRDDKQWTMRYAGMVEPNIQLLLGELLREDLPSIEMIAIQYVAFKRDAPYDMKPAVTAEYKIDPLKFLKLHCFKEHLYFDTPVIAIDIVKDDVVQRPVSVDAPSLEKELMAKKRADMRQSRRPVKRHDNKRDKGEVLEVDLHIDSLLDNTRGMSTADILNYQVDEFRRVMDANLKNHGKKIVFIHGKGEGVLRQALTKELNYKYKGHQVQDASFKEYGFGATQVTIK